ncbi:hypothetical protein TRIATDRAFT_302057, partial [Trichoderma atroviride IMI 206040]
TSKQIETRSTRHSSTLLSHAWFLAKSALDSEETQDSTQLSSGRASATTQQLRSAFVLFFLSCFFPPFPTLDIATTQTFLTACIPRGQKRVTARLPHIGLCLPPNSPRPPTYLQAPDNTAQRSTAQHSGLAKASAVSQHVHCHC